MADQPFRSAAQGFRPAWAEINLDAVRHNVGLLRRVSSPAPVCAVVKADGYGHGAVPVAEAALDAGVTWLAVALVEEGIELREAGIIAPILLLSEPEPEALVEARFRRLTPTLYTRRGVEAAIDAAGAHAERGSDTEGDDSAIPVPWSVHVKVDTGMHRVGADPTDVLDVVTAIEQAPVLRLEALWTHLAVADGSGDEDRAFTAEQLRRFEEVRHGLAGAGIRVPIVHAANSAAALSVPASRYDLVRCGIAVYGESPSEAVRDMIGEATGGVALRPVLSLRARVAHIRELAAGERPSYGRRRPLPERSLVATVPIGYADGVPRRLFEKGAEVLIAGRRRPLAGVVTMDQIVVDCGPLNGSAGAGEKEVAVGDEVVLLGRQGGEAVTAGEWASLLGTISYEILCGIGPRVPRVLTGTGRPGGDASRPG